MVLLDLERIMSEHISKEIYLPQVVSLLDR